MPRRARIRVIALRLFFMGAASVAASLRSADDVAPPTSPSRELLELVGAPAAALAPPIVEHDFTPGGDETLWRLLYAVRRFPLDDLDRWKKSDVPAAEVLAAPERYQAEIVAWSGRARRVTKGTLPHEAAERFDLEHYYRCELAIGPESTPVIVYSLAAPAAWQIDEPLDQPAAVTGFLVRLAAGQSAPGAADGEARPVLIAHRVAWFPASVLGDLQMDAGLFDELNPRPELTAEDRECFYQLLAAVGRTGPRQLLRQAPQKCPVEPLFNDPKNQRGKLVKLTGTARQAVRRIVDDADIQARFGIDHYYEIEIFTEDSQGNPLTFCVRELPKGFPTGGKIQEPVRIAGIFLKKWSYRVQTADEGQAGEQAARRRQLAPLIIGPGPIWLKPPPADYRFSTTIFVILFVIMTIVLWLVVWRMNRSGERFHKQIVRRLITTPDRSLDGLDIEDHGKPDFSNLG